MKKFLIRLPNMEKNPFWSQFTHDKGHFTLLQAYALQKGGGVFFQWPRGFQGGIVKKPHPSTWGEGGWKTQKIWPRGLRMAPNWYYQWLSEMIVVEFHIAVDKNWKGGFFKVLFDLYLCNMEPIKKLAQKLCCCL